MPKQEPIAELLGAVDALIIARVIGDDDKKALAALIKARRAVGEVKATTDQLLVVMEAQIKAAVERPIWNERDLCELLMRCDRSWLHRERAAGRWLNFEVDSRGKRFYTREQILANVRGEKPRLKQAA